ncbi:MAG: EamA family transporter RarD [Gammaproteobacteria bacterium]|nr:EamA family transporter RarD [Gammaproteobacteria bacterium]
MAPPTGNGQDPAEARTGALFAAGAFLIWGGFPLYFKLVAEIPAGEVLGHRILGSMLFVALLLSLLGRWREAREGLLSPSLRRRLTLSALLISVNWLVFIWAIAHDRVLDASLGYFINPLVNVVLGVLLLGERLRPLQWTAIGLAFLGVANLVWQQGALPWISLVLALSFGSYGLVRKQTSIGALSALFVETLLLAPLAVIYLVYLDLAGAGHFLRGPLATDGLLVLAGVLTALPLLLFGGAARRLRLSTLGLLQYSVPTAQFLLAVFVFGEPFTPGHAATFAIIWTALGLYALDLLRRQREVERLRGR